MSQDSIALIFSTLFACLAAAAACYFVYKSKAEVRAIRERFAPVVVIDDEIEKVNATLSGVRRSMEKMLSEQGKVSKEYAKKKLIYDSLLEKINDLEGRIDLAHVGFYEPHFSYETSAAYADALKKNRDKQKAMIKAKTAVASSTSWSVNGSKKQGSVMLKRNIDMTLRSFNNEVDVAISQVNWKNFDRIEEKIRKSFQAFNDFNKTMNILISRDYLALKLDELRLSFEEKQRKQQEAEALKEERAREREEAKAQRELALEAKKQEEQEEKSAASLEKAKADAEAAKGEEKNTLLKKVAELEEQLAIARAAKERALSMAQQTRAGHVYIISNIGSFGEDVFKIGMTRRVEPMERVWELGDASVPFPFDVHSLIFTEDAPALERRLQTAFDDCRVNKVNNRKEFFKVPLEKIKEVVSKEFPGSVIIDTPDAEEYIKSIPKDAVADIAHAIEPELFPAEV